MNEKISKSKRRCPFCRGQKWICWNLTYEYPQAYEDCFTFVDWNSEMVAYEDPREVYFIDECIKCGAVAS